MDSKKRLNIILLVAAGFIILILVGCLAYYEFKLSNPIVFTINTKNYTKNELSEYTKFPINTLKQNSKQVYIDLFNEYKTITAAKDASLQIDDKLIVKQKLDLLNKYTKYKDQNDYKKWADLRARYLAISEYMANPVISEKVDGYLFFFWFGTHMQEGFGGSTVNINSTQAEADKQYATNQANFYHDEISSGKISDQQAIDSIKKDPRLSFIGGMNYSTHFSPTSSIPWQTQVGGYKNIIETISNSKAGLGKVLPGYTSLKPGPGDSQQINTYLYFIDLRNYSSPYKSYQSRLADQKAALKVK